MTIREATKADILFLITFQTEMALETENVRLEIEVLKKGLNHLFDNPEKGKYYVAVVEGKPVGCLMTTFEYSEWRNGTVLWIQSVYVAKNYRGAGVYKNMYHYIQQLVKKDSSLRGIRLYADKRNLAAHKVYEKLGMNGDHYQVFEWMNL